MKTLRNLITIMCFLTACSMNSFAQDSKADEMKLKVFFHCANGKALLEKEMIKVEGVKSFVADLESKVCTVTYDKKILDKDKIVAAVEKVGYKTEFSKENTKINKACTHGEGEENHKH